MALIHSPKIVTDGLVFYYDMANGQKSYIGEPTTNLFSNTNVYLAASQNWTNAGVWTPNDDDTSMALPGAINTSVRKDLKILSGVITTASSQGAQFGSATVTVSPSTTYTMSCYYMQNRAMANNASPYMRGAVVNDSKAQFTYNGNANQGTWPVGEWIRITATATMQSNETGIYLSQYFGETVGDKIWMCGFQVEQRSYATPLVSGTRTNTQALVDLIGSNTVTANSLTYASDNTFSFNGSNNYATISSGSNFTFGAGDFTLETWYMPNVSYAASNGYIFDTSVNGTRLQLYNNNFTFVLQSQVASVIGPAGAGLNINTWHHAVGTRVGSTLTLYLNGVSVGTSTSSANLSDAGGTIGEYGGFGPYYFNGQISIIRVYKNKGLTASEVQQNFNATKERFFGYQALTYVNSSNITVTNNGTDSVTFTKNADDNSWNAQAYTTEAFTAPCTIEFSKLAGTSDNGASYAMIGWNTDPTTDAGYGSIDHASYPYQQVGYIVYNNGSQINEGKIWDPNKRFYLVYDIDGYIRHYNGNQLLYSANYGTGNKVYVDMSLYNTNTTYCKFSDVRVCRRSWNGSRYV